MEICEDCIFWETIDRTHYGECLNSVMEGMVRYSPGENRSVPIFTHRTMLCPWAIYDYDETRPTVEVKK